ncbi:MAG: hypothetical protein JWO91_3735 [Acidobacteriaceae bacterium]|nr:hypothetical protein [Acidobacteriaceae bacterium]
MFGKMNATPIVCFRHAPSSVGASVEDAVAQLLDLTEHPAITKWVQFPKALLLFLMVPGDPESGAFYIYDRHSRTWFWVDFEDDRFGGYSLADYERLVRQCRFLDIVESPSLLRARKPWTLQPGCRPRQTA